MIKLLILLLLVIILIFILQKFKIENFHEKTNKVENSKSEVAENCESCSSYCDFNPDPQTKPYIISRCLLQHTLLSSNTPQYRPTPSQGCKNHKDLSKISGCIDAIKHFRTNIDNLKNVNTLNPKCKCEYSLDGIPVENNPEKQSYNAWLKTF